VSHRTVDALREALREAAGDDALAWLDEVAAGGPAAVRSAFPAVGRRLGHGRLDGRDADRGPQAWRIEDAGRAVLLASLGDGALAELEELYRFGTAAERRGVLRALDVISPPDPVGRPLVADALRTNDAGVIAAALGRYAVSRLDDHELTQAVLKCVFTGIPVDRIDGLTHRATPELAQMLATYAHERVVAGRDVPADIWPLIDRHPPESTLDAIRSELDSPHVDRRLAAEAALAAHHAHGRRSE
jgi:hypothetical protein